VPLSVLVSPKASNLRASAENPLQLVVTTAASAARLACNNDAPPATASTIETAALTFHGWIWRVVSFDMAFFPTGSVPPVSPGRPGWFTDGKKAAFDGPQRHGRRPGCVGSGATFSP
jgi:hypothetical protein